MKKIGGEKNGGTRTILKHKGPKWYPADDVKTPVPSRKHVHKPTKLRKSITPGQILILLAGRFRGMRCVFLKQLPSGLLLVTGPYAVNGIPLRRVNQRYVIATSTKIDVAGCDVKAIDDKYFKREVSDDAADDAMQDDDDDKKPKKAKLSDEKIATQKKIDESLVKVVEKTADMKPYLRSLFTLKKGMNPHEIKF